MSRQSVTRRRFVQVAAASLAVPVARQTSAQNGVFGRIAFIKDGHIMEWTPDGVKVVREDGNASGPSWQPESNMLIYVRRDESYSNLISLDTDTGRTRRLTNSQSDLQQGSEAYVHDSDWIIDPFWSESGIIAFASTAENPNRTPQLWIMRYDDNLMFPAPTDYMEPGPIEKITVDASGKYACYTVVGEYLMSSYIGMRDLDTGLTWPVMEGARGAFDGAISPNGRWVMGTIRDSDGKSDLWLTNVETEQSTRLTDGEQASAVTWDYYGDSVAYLAFVGDGFSLRTFRLDFSGDEPGIDGDIQVLIASDKIDSTSRLSWKR